MSYAIIRNTNYKKDNLVGLYKHNERKNMNYSNKEINKNNSIKNYSIKTCNTTYLKAINQLIVKNNLKGRIIKTTNIACEFIITSDKTFFETISEEETKRYFKTAYDFVSNYKNLGEQYILSAKVHMDETTPHMHLVFVPVIQVKDRNGNIENKIACSEYWKGKDSYVELQDSFYSYITKAGFDLERGNNKENKHMPIEILKAVTNFENIKYEMEQEEIKPIETKNTDLILAQNMELIQYTKKLKLQLAKSYMAIQKVEHLQNENIDLKYKNEKLQKENTILKNYIEKTFETVKNLFNFPMDIFKRLVDNLVHNLEK